MVKSSKGKQRNSIKVGDVVIGKSGNVKGINWPLVNDTELLAGKSEKQRIARMGLVNKESIHPIQRLFLLEVNSDEAQEVSEIDNTMLKKWRESLTFFRNF